ncbi:helix-turn-helix domain-containing protein [Streptomyces sp. NBC_00433]
MPTNGSPERRPPYSVKQIARLLGVSLTTVYEEIARGELPAMAIGTGRGTYRIEPTAFDDYKTRCYARAVRSAETPAAA